MHAEDDETPQHFSTKFQPGGVALMRILKNFFFQRKKKEVRQLPRRQLLLLLRRSIEVIHKAAAPLCSAALVGWIRNTDAGR